MKQEIFIVIVNVLFVCLGNICRSPMAAGILARNYLEDGVDGVIESCGVMDWNHGSRADQRAIDVCLENGVDIRAHRARQIEVEDFHRFDLILVMDAGNEKAVRKLAPTTSGSKILRVAELEGDGDECDRSRMNKNRRNEIVAGQPSLDIADPYNSDLEAFRKTFKRLEKLLCLPLEF